MRKKRFPPHGSQGEHWELIVPPLLVITTTTCHGYISWNMEPNPKAIHAIKMLNRRAIVFQCLAAINTKVTKPTDDVLGVCRVRDTHAPCRTSPATDFVKKHTHQLIRHVGFRPTGRPAESLSGIKVHRMTSHFSCPDHPGFVFQVTIAHLLSALQQEVPVQSRTRTSDRSRSW